MQTMSCGVVSLQGNLIVMDILMVSASVLKPQKDGCLLARMGGHFVEPLEKPI